MSSEILTLIALNNLKIMPMAINKIPKIFILLLFFHPYFRVAVHCLLGIIYKKYSVSFS